MTSAWSVTARSTLRGASCGRGFSWRRSPARNASGRLLWPVVSRPVIISQGIHAVDSSTSRWRFSNVSSSSLASLGSRSSKRVLLVCASVRGSPDGRADVTVDLAEHDRDLEVAGLGPTAEGHVPQRPHRVGR